MRLGLYHEHQRPDRESYVHFKRENLDHSCSTMLQKKTCCDKDIPKGCCASKYAFDTLSTKLDYSGAYDTKSVMHYPSTAFARDKTNTLVIVKKVYEIPDLPPKKPSILDLDRVCKIYSNECRKKRAI